MSAHYTAMSLPFCLKEEVEHYSEEDDALDLAALPEMVMMSPQVHVRSWSAQGTKWNGQRKTGAEELSTDSGDDRFDESRSYTSQSEDAVEGFRCRSVFIQGESSPIFAQEPSSAVNPGVTGPPGLSLPLGACPKHSFDGAFGPAPALRQQQPYPSPPSSPPTHFPSFNDRSGNHMNSAPPRLPHFESSQPFHSGAPAGHFDCRSERAMPSPNQHFQAYSDDFSSNAPSPFGHQFGGNNNNINNINNINNTSSQHGGLNGFRNHSVSNVGSSNSSVYLAPSPSPSRTTITTMCTLEQSPSSECDDRKLSLRALASRARARGESLPSVGAVLHNVGRCAPCLFWFRGECEKGYSCTYCHNAHPGQVAKKVRPSKRTRELLRQKELEGGVIA